MTGYGNGSAVRNGVTVNAEIRSVNNRFFEFFARLPKYLQNRENELKELIRSRVNRGKVNLNVTVEKDDAGDIAFQVDEHAARTYAQVLTHLRDSAGLTGEITLDTLLHFSDVFTAERKDVLSDDEWNAVLDAVRDAVEGLNAMRSNEGELLSRDLRERLSLMEKALDEIEVLSRGRMEIERDKLMERISELIDRSKIDADRLELEIVLLADKLDVTEELVRFRSHVEYFRETLNGTASEGRKIGFLLQEMNREVNTIGSKSSDAAIARLVVTIKEELERIREQIQNVE